MLVLSPSVRDFVPWLCRWRASHEDYLTNNDAQPEKIKERDGFVKYNKTWSNTWMANHNISSLQPPFFLAGGRRAACHDYVAQCFSHFCKILRNEVNQFSETYRPGKRFQVRTLR